MGPAYHRSLVRYANAIFDHPAVQRGTANFWWLLGITVLFGWMALVGVVRAEFLRTLNFDYIRAAQALGVSDRGIIFRHMLPNAVVATSPSLPFIPV